MAYWKSNPQHFEFKHDDAEEKAAAAARAAALEAAAKFERERAENKEIGSGGWLYGASNPANPQNGAVPPRFMPPKDWMRPAADYQHLMTERARAPYPYPFGASGWPPAPKPESGWMGISTPKPETDWPEVLTPATTSQNDNDSRNHSRSPSPKPENHHSPPPDLQQTFDNGTANNRFKYIFLQIVREPGLFNYPTYFFTIVSTIKNFHKPILKPMFY